MPIIEFKSQNGKTVTKQIHTEVNFAQAVEWVSNYFNIPRENVRLEYHKEVKTANFLLSPGERRHIIRVKDSSKDQNQNVNEAEIIREEDGNRFLKNMIIKALMRNLQASIDAVKAQEPQEIAAAVDFVMNNDAGLMERFRKSYEYWRYKDIKPQNYGPFDKFS